MSEIAGFIVALFLLVAVLTLFAVIVRGILSLWCDYRIKRRFLQWLAKHPDKVNGASDIPKSLAEFSAQPAHFQGQDVAVTGLLLAVFGLAAVAAGYGLRVGNIAVGLYVGGLVCFVAGLSLALVVGIVRCVRALSH